MQQSAHLPSSRSGFTLLELLVVTTLIGILALIVVPRIVESSAKAKEKTCFHNRTQLNLALERYFVVNDSLATDLSDIDTNEYFPGGIPNCPLTGSAYTLDGTTKRITGHTTVGVNPGDH